MSIRFFAFFFICAFLLTAKTNAFEKPNSPGTPTIKASVIYRAFSRVILDLDQLFADIGLKFYACQIKINGSVVTFNGVGPCLYESLKLNFYKHEKSEIYVWATDQGGKSIDPIKVEWQTSQKGWTSIASEFLYMSFEETASKFVSAQNNRAKNEKICQAKEEFKETDLGNTIGMIKLTIPKNQELVDYFNLPFLNFMKGHELNIVAQMPGYIEKKRFYRIFIDADQGQITESHLQINTDINFVGTRDFCLKISANSNKVESWYIP